MKKNVLWPAVVLCLPITMGVGCHPRPATVDAGTAPGALSNDAGPPVRPQVRIEIKQLDGGLFSAPLDATATILLPLTQELVITANLPLHNYRVRIFDEIDRALASDDRPEETTTGVRYHITLLAPLRAGHRYSISLDAQAGATFDDGKGSVLGEERFDIRTEGEREKDAPIKRSQTKRHRHGT